jgi:hypothetical protein
MRLLSHTDILRKNHEDNIKKKSKVKILAGNERAQERVSGGKYKAGTDYKTGLVVFILDSDLKGAGDSAGGADEFAHRAPAALDPGDRSYHVIFDLKAAASADADTQAAAIALFFVDDRIFRHLFIHHSVSMLIRRHLDVCDISLINSSRPDYAGFPGR